MKKKLAALAAIVAGTVMMTMTSYAGQWKSDQNGWWYQNDDGSWPVNTWEWIADSTGLEKCYYFDQSGYCLTGTSTPDGYVVDSSGAWIVDGVVKTRTADSQVQKQEQTDNSVNRWLGTYVAQDKQVIQVSRVDSKNIWITFRGYGEEGWYTTEEVLDFKNEEKTIAKSDVLNVYGEKLGEDLYTISNDGTCIEVQSQSFRVGTYYAK
jgi:hypothetical protein